MAEGLGGGVWANVADGLGEKAVGVVVGEGGEACSIGAAGFGVPGFRELGEVVQFVVGEEEGAEGDGIGVYELFWV